MTKGDNDKTVLSFVGYPVFFDNQKKKKEIHDIAASDHKCTKAEDFFVDLVSGNEQEKGLVLARLKSAIVEPNSADIKCINEFLCYSGSTPQRKEKIINAIISVAGGSELLENLRRNGVNL